MGSSDSESSGSERSTHKKDKSHKKDKKDKKDKKGSGDEKKDKKDKKDKDKDKKDKDKDEKKDKKDKDKDKKDKDDKDKKDKDDKHKTESKPASHVAHALSGTALGGLAQEFLSGGSGHGGLFREGPGGPGGPPTIPSNPPTGSGTGASGQRIPVSTADAFPAQAAGPYAPFVDSAGQPVYVGSALVDGSNVQPARITPSGVFIAVNGAEVTHNGRYDLLPLTDAMEWVPASSGTPPPGKRLVEGGIENGSPLYHAAARVNSVLLPGKTGPAIGGALIPANGIATHVAQGYYVLAWKQ
ncbi:hypothetical protein FRC07_002413 [Ceratobasidium sp. 392]|nr:hypothetical protein FRC07_002413 [Ceratobasidium sp. 392]